jgi:hypothetical protein
MEIKHREQLIAGLLPADGCVLLAADPKTGKSTLALELCRAVATGTPALGALDTAHGATLYWMADDTSRDRFVRNYQQTFGREPLHNFEAYLERLPLHSGGLDLLRAALRRTGARLAIIDCLTAVRHIRAEKSDFVLEEFDELRMLSDLGREHHCCILVIHHLASGRRASNTNPFIGTAGSFALNGAADGLIALGVFGITRTERILTAAHRDDVPQRMLYARDAGGRLFYLGGDDWVDLWPDALAAYRLISDSTFDGTAVGNALGVSDRAGRAKLARWRTAGIAEDLGGKKHAWANAFLKAVHRLEGGRQ